MSAIKDKVKSEITVPHTIPIDILDDLGSRFIINVPIEERQDLIRLCFQVELAHWFFLDFYCTQENLKLKTCGMKEFTIHMFQHIPFLKQYASMVNEVLEQWREYKQSVPTFGAIILSENYSHVLLVQSYWSKASWGFPKGKINKDETPLHCAAREVLEETGFEISHLLNANEFIETVANDQLTRLYIVSGVRRDVKFEPRTRNEIKAVEWFPISDLPTSRKDMTPKIKCGYGPSSFFMVLPFMRRLKAWIKDKTQKTSRRPRHKSLTDVEIEPQFVKSHSDKAAARAKRFQQSLQTEIETYKALQSQKVPTNGTQKNVKSLDKSRSSRRRLFLGEENGKVQKSKEPDPEFTAPSWAYFKFDRQAIIKCLNDCQHNFQSKLALNVG
nr:PREDICTED: m7GpppN-mRNA hydrolase isoform X1 [Bemisia tabaci]